MKLLMKWLLLALLLAIVITGCAPMATPTFTPTVLVATPTPVPLPTATPTTAPLPTPTPMTVPLPTPTITEPLPTTPEEVPRISLEEVKELMDSGADIVIVDDQPRSVYEQGHIKGAISLPWAMEITPIDTQQLPRDKLIITYCDCGPGEADSADIALRLIQMGFENVKVLADPSIRGWIEAGYPMGE
jgi:rhodanese-related sulfurtransferase